MRYRNNDLWPEFIVNNLCGLCGQSGRIQAIRTVTPAGYVVNLPAGRFCICPNGRALKAALEQQAKKKKAKAAQ